jgi:hypothetical protein
MSLGEGVECAMKLGALRKIFAVCAVPTLYGPLLGCQVFGPNAIQAGRLSYNEVIQRTSMVQTLANIIRVKNAEPTSFLDITQINAGVLAQGIGVGGVTNIGLNKLGSANLSLEYQEAPTIQYQPLTGAALISQLSTPVTTESIANLYHSDLPFASLLSLTLERFTPGYTDYGSAINALIALDDFGAILITPVLTESAFSQSGKKSSDSSAKSDDKKTNPVLVISLLPFHPYTGKKLEEADTQRRIQSLWCRLVALLLEPNTPCPGVTQLTLTTSVPPRERRKVFDQTVNFLRTRSAIGILKAATETPAPLIGFVSEALFQKIRGHPWNRDPALLRCPSSSFYTLLPEDEDPRDHPNANPQITNEVQSFILNSANTGACLYTTSDFLDPNDFDKAKREDRLAFLRRFLLVIVSDRELPNSYVSYSNGRQWYSIDSDDEISKRNFVLISDLLIIQATTTPPPSLTAITVGPR